MTLQRVSAIVTAAVLAAGTTAVAQNPGPDPNPPVIAIMDFTNAAMVDHATYQPFTAGLAGMLLSELRPNPRVRLVERAQLKTVLDEIALGRSGAVDPATAARVGKVLGARHMIFGSFVIDRKGNLRIDARAVNVETSLVEHVETVTDEADNLLRAVQKLGQQLSQRLRLPTDPRGSAAPAEAKPQEGKRGQLLVDLKYARALEEEDRKNTVKAVQLYREYLAESPAGYAANLRLEAESRIRVLSGGSE
jgi:TolB-like protein